MYHIRISDDMKKHNMKIRLDLEMLEKETARINMESSAASILEALPSWRSI